jgi:NAD(P)-dependent dehydrogenase (short-subunit alcohol dehydrogenase family)
MGRLDNRVALITGGTSGIGEATVRLFVAEGAKVAFTGRAEEKGLALAEELGGETRFYQADIMTEAGVREPIEAAARDFGRLDILFNNAGGPTGGSVEDVTDEQVRYAFDLLFTSVVLGIRHAAPIMKAQGHGRIINNSSVASMRTGMGGYLYSAAKAAVTQITRMAGMELGRHGVTVNCISPGGIVTPIFYGGSPVARALDPEHDAKRMAKLSVNLGKATPLQRAGAAKDIAVGALYLASDEGGYVNCHDLVIDAGMTAGGKTNYELPA